MLRRIHRQPPPVDLYQEFANRGYINPTLISRKELEQSFEWAAGFPTGGKHLNVRLPTFKWRTWNHIGNPSAPVHKQTFDQIRIKTQAKVEQARQAAQQRAEQQRAQLEQQLQNTRNELANAQQNVTQLRNTIATLNEQSVQDRARVAQLAERVASLGDQLQVSREINAELLTAITAQNRRIEELTQAVASLQVTEVRVQQLQSVLRQFLQQAARA